MGVKSIPLTKQEILNAMSKTNSNMGAARYLNVSYVHYKKYASLYYDEETGKTLLEKHINRGGKNAPKIFLKSGKTPKFIDIVEGRASIRWFKPEHLKERLIMEGHIMHECAVCGYNQTRPLDHKSPLILRYKDGNRQNLRRENVDLICYNCYFITIGDIFTKKQQIELDTSVASPLDQSTDWELDEYQKERLKKLALVDEESNEKDTIINGFDIAARKG